MVHYLHDDEYRILHGRKQSSLTRKVAKSLYPDAAAIKRVTGGYAVFDTWTDYETWKKQK